MDRSKFKLHLSMLASIFPALYLLGVSSASANTTLQLRTDSNIQGCTFDRTRAFPERTHGETLEGSFSINCNNARPYRLATHLSPLATLRTEQGSSYRVRLFVRNGAPACEGGKKHPDAIAFHSGTRDMSIETSSGVTNWNYCLQADKRGGDLDISDGWPIQGQLDVDLIDPNRGHWLPQSASMISLPFPNNVSELSDDMILLMDTLLANIGGPKNVHIQIHAHASSVGDADYNHDLSIMRLKHVREWLQQEGQVPRSSIWGQAWGESRPFAVKTIEDEHVQNRRVDIVFLPSEDADVQDLPKAEIQEEVRPDIESETERSGEGVVVEPHPPVPNFEEELIQQSQHQKKGG